jgi:5'-nucleotidase
MGAAIEGCILGVPSVGLSLADYEKGADFAESCRLGRMVVRHVLKEGLPRGTYLSLNVPNVASVKGINVCSQADGHFINEYVYAENPAGQAVYWLTGSLSVKEPPLPEYDTISLDKGYASLVPCKIDVTDYAFMEKLKETWP